MISSLPTIAKAAELIRAGEILPIDLVEYCLARIDRFEDQIHAWVMIDREGARKLAHEQAELLSQGIDPGPLTGIPIGIKDIIDVVGWPTKAGSPLREDHVAETDATLVAHLRQAGAIILGKTVTTQFACFDPPPTRNPWNMQHTPGGSSSGSAAAVSLEMCMAAIGTQTGGSIIRPASYCGVAGFKPSFGHVSLDGVVPVSQHLDHAGPIARNVADLAAVFAELKLEFACWNPQQVFGDFSVHPSEPFGFARLGSEPRFRHYRPVTQYFSEHETLEIAAVTRPAMAELLDSWSEENTFRLPPSFNNVHGNHYRIMAFEAAECHRQAYSTSPADFGSNISKLIEDGFRTTRSEYLAALRHQLTFQVELDQAFADGSIAIMPSTNTTAPASLETTGDPKFNSPWSYAGVPAITIPCGIAANGMPCGLQLVGPRNSEVKLLQAAAWCEERLGFDLKPELNCS